MLSETCVAWARTQRAELRDDPSVLETSTDRESYLESITRLFKAKSDVKSNRPISLINAYDSISLWYQQLHGGPKTTRYLSRSAKKFRSIVGRVKNPYELLFIKLPEWARCSFEQDELVEQLSAAKIEIENTTLRYQELIKDHISSTLTIIL